jgi:hypothetical protein
MRYGIVLFSGQLGRFDISRARIEFNQAASQNRFGSLLWSVLSRPLDSVEVMENQQDLSTIFTVLRTGESHDISIMSVLCEHLKANTVVKSSVVTAWREMASDALGYLGDFKDLWELLGSLPKELCESVSISEMTVIIFRMYSKESSLYKNVNFFMRSFPVEIVNKFINELRGILSIFICFSHQSIIWRYKTLLKNQLLSLVDFLRLIQDACPPIYQSLAMLFYGVHLQAHLGILKSRFEILFKMRKESYLRFIFPQGILQWTSVVILLFRNLKCCFRRTPPFVLTTLLLASDF